MQCACLYTFQPFSGISVTALDFGPPLGPDCSSWILAAGSELGDVNFWNLNLSCADLLGTIDSLYCHGSTVKKLAWTPSSMLKPFSLRSSSELNYATSSSTSSSTLPTSHPMTSSFTLPDHPPSTFTSSNKAIANSNISCEVNPLWRLASCGEDHTVRIFHISE